MDYEDDFFDQFDSDPVGSSSDYDLFNDQGGVEKGLDPLNFRDPMNAYFFLSDDVQDEIGRSQKRKMKCLSCGHEFFGQIGDYCPRCYGTQLSEII